MADLTVSNACAALRYSISSFYACDVLAIGLVRNVLNLSTKAIVSTR
jgi:hypothetical protein